MARGSSLDDLFLILGLGVVGFMAYNEWYKGKGFEEVFTDIDTKLRAFIDSIASQLPVLPPVPTFQPPQAAGASIIPTPTYTPPPETTPPTTKSGKAATPKETGELQRQPSVSAPPPSSGGAIVGMAGDWDTNAKSEATRANMDKNNVTFIVGLGDYSYGPAAQTWFDKVITSRYKGRMVGAQGNHDNDSYLAPFGMSKWNDAFKVAPNFAVVTIDTEGGISAGELDTLTAKAKGMGVKHVAYVMHKPYYTSSDGHHKGSENKSGSVIDAAAKKHGIKLVISGHNHVYEHFFSGGIHYLTVGTGGRKFYSTGCKAGGAVKCLNNTNGFLKISVGASLLCQFIANSSGSAQDSFTVS